MAEIVPGQVLDQYEALDVIARSGMMTILRACDLDDGRMVALKAPRLRHESDLVFHQRFLREERIDQKVTGSGVTILKIQKAAGFLGDPLTL